jgi:archaemetzincin
MPEIEIFTSDFNHPLLLDKIVHTTSDLLKLNFFIRKTERDLHEFYNPDRYQYDATRILQYFEGQLKKEKALILTSVDIYLPIFTHVFGLAKLGGTAAVVSTYRLDDRYYGLPQNRDRLLARIIKEILHELGHLYNLRHCDNYQCVMASSTTADDLDIKQPVFCSKCITNLPGQQ